MEKIGMYIDGCQAWASNGATFKTEDPVTGEAWAELPAATAADADRAVEAAHRAFTQGPWATMTPTQRGHLVHKMGDVIKANARKLAELEVRENGKLMAEMLGQMTYMAEWFYYYGGLADKIEGAVTPIDKPGMLHYITYEPMGVVAAITPWNSPLLLTAWKLAPALAAGNTVVVKPSEFASAGMIEFCRLFTEAGFPPGVVNAVTGFGDPVGARLVSHPLVARVAFTGGEAGGRHVAKAAAENFKRVSLELGGKSPNIVFDDADVNEAAMGAISGVFAATGQTCMAGSRLLVHRSIHDAVVGRIVELLSDAKIGNPLDDDTDVGPVATRAQYQKVLDYIAIAKAEGAKCAFGGEIAKVDGLPNGFFVKPTVFTGVHNQMRIAREEVFGPILCVIPFDTDDEAVAIANDTPYGLAAGIWTASIERAIQIPKRIHAGTVWVNTYRVVSYMAPFGGFKHSGIGRENGREAIMEYLEPKSIFINTNKKRSKSPFVLG